MTKEEYAKSQIDSYYDECQDWVVSNYDVDDIDDEDFEKAIKESIYEAYLGQLYLIDDEDDDIWLVEDYDMLESDIRYEIRRRLKLD